MYTGGLCFHCGTPLSESEKVFDEEEQQAQTEKELLQKELIEQKRKEAAERIASHMLTTSFSYDGYSVKKYLGLVSGDTIIGTGIFSTLDAALSDLFGVEAYDYSQKVALAKERATLYMVNASIKKGGNAIIGVSFDVTSFSGDLIGVSVNGTSVIIEENINSPHNYQLEIRKI